MLEQTVGRVEEKSEIIAIFNKYKDTFDNLIDSSHTKSPDWLEFPNWSGPMNKDTCNISRSRNDSTNLSEKDCKYVLIILYEQVPNI